MASALLNFDEALDVQMLENVMFAVHNPQTPPQEREAANRIIDEFQSHPQSWTRVDTILDHAVQPTTKFFALGILENLVRHRWNILPESQQRGIRDYIVDHVLKLSENDDQRNQQRVILSKMNAVLVLILTYEWPHNWPSFVPEIVEASKRSESVCENNMEILKLLSEEIFDFSRGRMTRTKTQNLKDSLTKDFYAIFQLCDYVLSSSSKPSLLLATLNALERFLQWIPLGYIFETGMVMLLAQKFFPEPIFRNASLQCLTEVAALEIDGQDDKFQTLFNAIMMALSNILPLSRSRSANSQLSVAFNRGTEEDQQFVQVLALFLAQFFKTHGRALENADCEELLLAGHNYLVQISLVRDTEIFKICLEYWSVLAQRLYHDAPVMNSPLNLGQNIVTASRMLYANVLSDVRAVMISRMAKPEEILITEDDNGNIIRQRMEDTDSLILYKSMKETLVFLTHLDYEDTQNIMLERLAAQMDGTEWSWMNLNTLCWAIGSVSGAFPKEHESRFLVTVIKDLLTLTTEKRGKDNKAVVASNIMYIVGQYPRFLKAHWRFLKTVVNKLIEFMHEPHPGVQDMSCDTFLKIARRCKRKFVIPQMGENRIAEPRPFIEELIEKIGSTISDLEEGQIHTFYEAIGEMISAANDPHTKESLIDKLMFLPNQTWAEIVKRASMDVNVLSDVDAMRHISTILKTNERTCAPVGQVFLAQLGNIYLDMLHVYKVYSEQISNTVQRDGARATTRYDMKAMRTVKCDVLKLVQTFVEKSNNIQPIMQNLLPPLLKPVLEDYRQAIPEARDPQVLALLAEIVNKCQKEIINDVPIILDAVFESTLNMITANFSDFPDHRVQFFKLLRAIINHCFEALLAMSPQHFKLIVDSVVWAFRHQMRNVSEMGLNTLFELLVNVERSNVADEFYQHFFLSLLNDILAVMTDSFHKSGFNQQCRLLMNMFASIESGNIRAPLWDPSQGNFSNNQQYMREYVANLLATSFPNMTQNQVRDVVTGMFVLSNQDLSKFKNHLRDFLVAIQEFGKSGDDNAQLYLQDQEAENSAKQLEETQRLLSIPGMIGPNDARRDSTRDDMED